MDKIEINQIEFNETTNLITLLECSKESDVELIYKLIKGENDFIVTWTSKDSKRFSRLIIGNQLMPKLSNGEMIITSAGAKNE